MKKNCWNIIIDALSLLVFVSMISTGILLKFVLSPGSGRVEMLMKGGGKFEKTIDMLMGLTRHEWGEVHFYISIAFLALLVVHLILHWNWIQCVSFGSKNNPQPLKRKIASIGIIVFIILSLIFPWIGAKQTYTKSEFLKIREIK